jgi:hypothetical protein
VPDTVKALTIRQPWADAIVHLVGNPKRTENRTRPTKYRGLVLIHAGLTGDRVAVLAGVPVGPDKRGAVIGTAQIIGCHPGMGCCAPWGMMQASRSEPPIWHWELADVRPLAAPVPAKGQLGLWNPPAEVLAAVLDQPCPECTGAEDCHQLGCQQPAAVSR